MRILVLQESDWIEKGPHQGHHLMERLSKKGHEVKVIDYEILWRSHKDKGLISKRRTFKNVHKAVDGGDITVIRSSIIKFPAMDYVSLLYTHRKEIKRQLNEFNPDVIVGFGILNTMLAIRLRGKIPFVYYLIDSLHQLLPQKAFHPLAKYIESRNMKNADKVITINEKLKDYAIAMGANPDATYVVRAGIDFKRFNPNLDTHVIRKHYGIQEDDIILLFTGFFRGRIAKISGLVEVALELSRVNDTHIKFLIVGEGDASNELQEIRKRYNLQDSLILAGKKSYDEIPAFICASDICLLPYHNVELTKDIVPIKMYDYMAMGKPVISTKLPGVVKEFGEDNGVIYVDRPEDILRNAIELANNGNVKEYGLKARRLVEKYNWDDMVDEFERFLEEVIKVRGGK